MQMFSSHLKLFGLEIRLDYLSQISSIYWSGLSQKYHYIFFSLGISVSTPDQNQEMEGNSTLNQQKKG